MSVIATLILFILRLLSVAMVGWLRPTIG